MRNQARLSDGTLVKDEEIWAGPLRAEYRNHITGERRAATLEEAALLPDVDSLRIQELLATSPDVVTARQQWELIQLLAKRSGLTGLFTLASTQEAVPEVGILKSAGSVVVNGVKSLYNRVLG